MKVFVEEQRFKKWILAGIMIVPLAGGLIPLLLGKEEIPEFNSEAFWGLSITFIIVLAVMGLLLSIKLSTKINEQGIYYQFFPIHFSEKFIAWTSIEQCYITKYNSLSKFGGYGYRVCMFGKKKRNYYECWRKNRNSISFKK